MDEIIQNNYNLNIKKYISAADEKGRDNYDAIQDDIDRIEQEINQIHQEIDVLINTIGVPDQ